MSLELLIEKAGKLWVIAHLGRSLAVDGKLLRINRQVGSVPLYPMVDKPFKAEHTTCAKIYPKEGTMSVFTSRITIMLLVLSVLMAACQPVQPVDGSGAQTGASAISAEQTAVEAKIKSALEAAPAAVTDAATVVDWPTAPGTEPALLRQGSNEWLCLPDNPATPGPDPMCVDSTWAAWMNAYMAGTEPQVTKLGIAYMLAGGSEASNVDPFATQPAAGEDRFMSPPHIMLLRPGGYDPADFTTDQTSGGPYIMWEGTPYEHLMVPVVAASEPTGPVAITESAETKIRNVMGAAPQLIGKDATIMDWPTEPGGEMTMLRGGNNTWVCVPDWPATPHNDPMCFDPTWTAWMGAFMAGAEPKVTTLGVSYMLSGGELASSADPFAMQPAPGDDWVRPAAHVMLVAPGGFDAADFGVDYTSGKPWIAWDETPFEFLIIPVE